MSGARRIKPRAPRRNVVGSGQDIEKCWTELELSLRQIRTRSHSELSFEQLYRNAYRMVLKKEGALLYERFTALETDWLIQHVQPTVLDSVQGVLLGKASRGIAGESLERERMAGEQLMKALKSVWEDHIVCMSMTTDVLMYLDRVYCDESHRMKVFPMTMGLFRNHILFARVPDSQLGGHVISTVNDSFSVLGSLISVVLAQVELERKGDVVDKNLIRSCMYMLEGLYETDQEEESTKLYLTRFQSEFLNESRIYFQEEGQRLLETIDAGSYCRHVQKRIREEEQRCGSTLPKLTTGVIRAVVEQELIEKNIKDVINLPNSGVSFMLDDNRIDELKDVYMLISRVDNTKGALKLAVQKRIVELGSEVNNTAITTAKQPPSKPEGDAKATERPAGQQTVAAIQWVNDVLALKDRYDVFLMQAFADDKGLQTAFTNSFTEFINNFERASEYLSLFFDENMKKGIKGKSEVEIDSMVDKGIMLLRYISDKDLFETYYRKHLARRLILKKSASMDAEKQILVKMKMEIGNALTSKIEPMFKDIDISDDLTAGYKAHMAGSAEVGSKTRELEIHVLTSTMWPVDGLSTIQDDSSSQFIWPPELAKLKASFTNFYLSKHNGRKLTWPGRLGSVDIRAYFPQAKSSVKTRDLNCSTFSAMILLLFQDIPIGETLTMSEIQARTGIPDEQVTKNLQSLAVAPKTRILLKEPMSRDIKPEDKFSFNAAFSSQFQKIKIGVVATNRAETINERKTTTDKNDESRQHVIDAALVRVMKQRKLLSHTELILEVVNVLKPRFKPDIPMVKKRIDSLLEREYLERVGEDIDKPAYKYLA